MSSDARNSLIVSGAVLGSVALFWLILSYFPGQEMLVFGVLGFVWAAVRLVRDEAGTPAND